MTLGRADLTVPVRVPAGERWRYGLGFPFQVSTDRAALFCNLRGARGHDFEVGTDVLIFSDLARLDPAGAVAVARNHVEPNPAARRRGEKAVIVKYPTRGGFVPLGARRADGSPHPHAGTGFGICQTAAWRPDRAGPYEDTEAHESFELCQLAYDGSELRVTGTERIEYGELLPGRVLTNPGITNAIADGDDLLFAMGENIDSCGTRNPRLLGGSFRGSGVARWRRGAAGWRPHGFVPITESDASFEPSVVRDVDGSLLFCARGVGETAGNDIRVWRSTDAGRTWPKLIHVRGARGSAPICLNQAADGTPYVASNLYEVLLHPVAERFMPERDAAGRIRGGGRLREKLCFWPLDPARTGVEIPSVVRDGRAEFGAPPSGGTWWIDHPSAATVRLADGRWHNVVVIRICDGGEVQSSFDKLCCDAPAPQSGTYLEEVTSPGAPFPPWRF
jgi:hypothetical protein